MDNYEEAMERKRKLAKKFDLGPPMGGEPIAEEAAANMEQMALAHSHVLEMGELRMKTETRRFGGNPLPHEPGGAAYWRSVDKPEDK